MSWSALAAKQRTAAPVAPPAYKAPSEDITLRLVLDSGAILTGGSKLDKYGPTTYYVTIPGVLNEIKDKQARHLLDTFPYTIHTRAVSEQAMKHVCAFARATGDLSSLSRVDLQLIALAYMMEREVNGDKFLRPAPTAQRATTLEHLMKSHSKRQRELSAAVATPGDGGGDGGGGDSGAAGASATSGDAAVPPMDGGGADNDVSTQQPESADASTSSGKRDDDDDDDDGKQDDNDDGKQDDGGDDGDGDCDGDRDDNDNDDDEGDWITPDNLGEFVAADGGTLNEDDDTASSSAAAAAAAGGSEAESCVASITTDYAMQNVMLQMGLRLITVGGKRVETLMQWFKRCHACFHCTRDMTCRYCASCGGHTMIKVSVWVDADGLAHYRQSNRTIYNKRGTKFSIPKARGGRRNKDLVLRADASRDTYTRRQADTSSRFQDAVEFGWDAVSAPRQETRFAYGFTNVNAARRPTGNKKKRNRKKK